jgi:hypothetical protein
MYQLDFIKIKNVCFVKDSKKIKREATDWRKIFANHIFNEHICVQSIHIVLKTQEEEANN